MDGTAAGGDGRWHLTSPTGEAVAFKESDAEPVEVLALKQIEETKAKETETDLQASVAEALATGGSVDDTVDEEGEVAPEPSIEEPKPETAAEKAADAAQDDAE